MADELDDDSLIGSLEVGNVNQAAGDVIWVTPKVNGQTLKMEQDTGLAVSTLPVQKYKEMFPNTPLVAIETILKNLLRREDNNGRKTTSLCRIQQSCMW